MYSLFLLDAKNDFGVKAKNKYAPDLFQNLETETYSLFLKSIYKKQIKLAKFLIWMPIWLPILPHIMLKLLN